MFSDGGQDVPLFLAFVPVVVLARHVLRAEV